MYSSCIIFRFLDSVSKTEHLAQVAFQVRIKPDAYDITKETLGGIRSGIVFDSLFRNEELEWSTKANSATILTGLLVKVHK